MRFISNKEIRPRDIISMGPSWLDTKQAVNLIDIQPISKVRRMSSGTPYQDVQKVVKVDHLLVLKIGGGTGAWNSDDFMIQVLEPSGAVCFITTFGCTIIKHV